MSGTILSLWYAMGDLNPFDHSLGLTLLAEWKERNDGLVPHAFFKGSPNFALSISAFAVEGWLFYGAVNSVTPQIVLDLGLRTSPGNLHLATRIQPSHTLLLYTPDVRSAYETY